MDKTNMTSLVDILHKEGCSCVIYNNGKTTLCHERGVKDLYRLLRSENNILNGAMIADKVIGKGAAALMILGGVREVYADVISTPALELFATLSIVVSYAQAVPNIVNRAGTGICPVESLCMTCQTAEECLPLIEKFINEITKTT